MLRNSLLLSALFLVPAACGGGGGAAAGGNAAPGQPGAVYVALDTATGSEALVQFQVAAVALERADGSLTGNLLGTPQMVTFADPSGELDGLALASVPTGDYDSVHLLIAPGSGIALYPNGTTAPVTLAADLEVPIADGLQHLATGRSWLALGQNGARPPAAGAALRQWQPAMSCRADGSTQTLYGVRVAAVQAGGLVTQVGVVDDGALQVEFAAGCVFDDHPRGADDFLRSSARGDDLALDGTLHRDGRFVASHVHRHGRGNDGPRLLGRITELRPATSSFVLHVLAEVRRGDRRLLPVPEDVLVDATAARIHHSDDRRVLGFADLQLEQLAKVEWTSRTPVVGDLDLVVAREVEVTSGSVPMRPEWEGAVQSVDLQARTIVVVPRGDDPIVIDGQSVTSADVHVGTELVIERRERRGGGRTTIGLDGVVAGERIWWRGTVTGPNAIDASWVRVRADG